MTIRWKPATAPNIVVYVLLYSDTGPAGEFTEPVQIMNAPIGPNWDAEEGLYTYDDPAGVSYRLYRMSTVDSAGAIFTDTTSSVRRRQRPLPTPGAEYLPARSQPQRSRRHTYVTPREPWSRVRRCATPKKTGTLRSTAKSSVSPQQRRRNGFFILVEPGNTFVLQVPPTQRIRAGHGRNHDLRTTCHRCNISTCRSTRRVSWRCGNPSVGHDAHRSRR